MEEAIMSNLFILFQNFEKQVKLFFSILLILTLGYSCLRIHGNGGSPTQCKQESEDKV